jgi:hypothetical protein
VFFARFSTLRRPVSARPHHQADRTGRRRGLRPVAVASGTAVAAVMLIGTAFVPAASAATTVQLGTATPFAVLGATAVTDIPTSSITGDVGLSPAAGSAYAGLTQAEVTGSIFETSAGGPAGAIADPALLTDAQNDLTTAYNAAAAQPPITTFTAGDNQLGGQTLTAGVYAFGGASTANVTAASPLVLNGQGDPNSVFVFQASSSLVTAAGSAIELENGALACNVFWQVGSSATLGGSSTFVGTIMAADSATLGSAATVQGRVLAETGDVTLDADTITAPLACTAASVTTTTAAPTGAAGIGGTAAGTAGTSAATGSGGAAAGSAGTTSSATSTGVVPSGFPATGYGGAAHSRDNDLIVVGVLALAGSAAVVINAARRRRHLPARVTATRAP